jgi:hypothetical protein
MWVIEGRNAKPAPCDGLNAGDRAQLEDGTIELPGILTDASDETVRTICHAVEISADGDFTLQKSALEQWGYISNTPALLRYCVLIRSLGAFIALAYEKAILDI